ncbi:alpha/beta hydrolase [Flavicella marina]|uniref:alpha/beta hydrolase n=1 Tax=Flavicella marina TaxID=1475951 RepID=UPI0012653A96|nr:alpha/beta hydrolase [Flavicella marina]
MKKHVYFVPGTAANSKIFERIALPKEQFEMHFLEWISPISKNENLVSYAKRFSERIRHKNPIIIGVSFGGVLTQEISKILPCEKVVIISSIQNKYELPARLKLIKFSKLYRLAPIKLIDPIEKLIALLYGKKAKNRIDAYKMYLSIRAPLYLKWAIHAVLNWEQKISLPNTIHLHGTNDKIFPIENIHHCIPIQKGSHIMIINKAHIINKILLEKLQ